MAIKAADMLIARRADTRARADFATWKMLAKLNGFSALPAEAQSFLESYRPLLARMTEADASEATIQLMYKSYYAEMGGSGTPPEIPSRASEPATDTGNVTAFRRPPAAAEARRIRPGDQTTASGGADLCVPRRGLCRHPLLLALTRASRNGAPIANSPRGEIFSMRDHFIATARRSERMPGIMAAFVQQFQRSNSKFHLEER